MNEFNRSPILYLYNTFIKHFYFYILSSENNKINYEKSCILSRIY